MQAFRSDPTVSRDGNEVLQREEAFGEEEALTRAQQSALQQLVALLAAPLGEARARDIAARACEAAAGEGYPPIAFAMGTNLEVEHILSIYVDWKASDEIAWQANRIFETLELPDRWDWNAGDVPQSMTPVFRDLGQWLSARGYHLWHVETDGDDALAFPVEHKNAAQAQRLAREAGMALFTIEEAARYYGDELQ